MRTMQTFPHRVLGFFCAGMVSLLRTAKIAPMVCIDLVALPLCFMVAMLLRGGELKLAAPYGPAFYLIVALVTIGTFSISDLYRAVIRFIDDRLLSATGLALGIAVLCMYLMLFAINDAVFPRSALAVYWFIVFSYVGTSHIGMRNFLRNHGRRRPASDAVAIYGAGPAGARLAQNALRPSVPETCITCLMACETRKRSMSESMVKAIVSEYTPQSPAAAFAPAQIPEPEVESGKARLSPIHKFVPFRI
jgi:FlaA1/EpsC-like NDP-sugar epimerase